MLMFFRFAVITIRALRGRRRGLPTGLSSVLMTTRWPDCDLNGHMNNARYLQVMDLGR